MRYQIILNLLFNKQSSIHSENTTPLIHGLFEIAIFEPITGNGCPIGNHFLSFKQHRCSFAAEHHIERKRGHGNEARPTQRGRKLMHEILIGGRNGRHCIQGTSHVVILNGVGENTGHVVHVYPWQPLVPGSQFAAEAHPEGPEDALDHAAISATSHACKERNNIEMVMFYKNMSIVFLVKSRLSEGELYKLIDSIQKWLKHTSIHITYILFNKHVNPK